jgi:hypothetical protein
VSTRRLGRSPFSARELMLAGIFGVLLAVTLFLLTSMEPNQRTLGLCYPSTEVGFDPWTGPPHGATIYCPALEIQAGPTALPSVTQTASTRETPTPPELANRQAVPVPLGFVLGVLVVLLPSAPIRARRPS